MTNKDYYVRVLENLIAPDTGRPHDKETINDALRFAIDCLNGDGEVIAIFPDEFEQMKRNLIKRLHAVEETISDLAKEVEDIVGEVEDAGFI